MKSRFIKFFFGGIILLAIISVAVMLLWNWLMPTIFGLVTINIWQSLGLFALCRILLGGFGRGRQFFNHHENPIHKRWREMTPEQQKEFVEKRRRFGMGRHFCDNATNNGESARKE